MLEHGVFAVIVRNGTSIVDPALSLTAADRRLELQARLRLRVMSL
jgi:hypothetical protein